MKCKNCIHWNNPQLVGFGLSRGDCSEICYTSDPFAGDMINSVTLDGKRTIIPSKPNQIISTMENFGCVRFKRKPFSFKNIIKCLMT